MSSMCDDDYIILTECRHPSSCTHRRTSRDGLIPFFTGCKVTHNQENGQIFCGLFLFFCQCRHLCTGKYCLNVCPQIGAPVMADARFRSACALVLPMRSLLYILYIAAPVMAYALGAHGFSLRQIMTQPILHYRDYFFKRYFSFFYAG